MDNETKVVLMHAAAAVILGYVSFIIQHALVALGLAVVVYLIFVRIIKAKIPVHEDKNWWIGNSGFLFFLTWLVVWTLLYNIVMYSTF